MSVMDSIEEKYQQEIAALKAENEQLRKNSEWQATEIETLRKRVFLFQPRLVAHILMKPSGARRCDR